MEAFRGLRRRRPFLVKGRLLVLKGINRAILVCLGSAVPMLSLASGCSASRPAVDVYLEAATLREQGQAGLAVEKLKQAIEADQGFVLAYSELGQIYLGKGDLQDAAWAFEKATALDAWSFSDHVGLARVYVKQGNVGKAGGAYGRAAKLAPENLAAQLGAAECYLKAGDLVRALAHAELAGQIEEPPRAALRLLGRVHEAQGDYERAVATYQQLADVDGDTPEAMLAMALAYIRNEKVDEARKVLLSVLQRWPSEARAFRHLAYCLLKLGDTDRAIEMYEEAVDLEGRDWEAHRGLGVAYMVKSHQNADDRWQRLALRHWQQALAICPDQSRGEELQKLIKEHSATTNPLQGLDY